MVRKAVGRPVSKPITISSLACHMLTLFLFLPLLHTALRTRRPTAISSSLFDFGPSVFHAQSHSFLRGCKRSFVSTSERRSPYRKHDACRHANTISPLIWKNTNRHGI